MTLNTHLGIDASLCGKVVTLEEGSAVVELKTTQSMRADAQGLVHGGFVFGAADYAAMAAVNAPTAVLAAAQCRFMAPSKVGDLLRFEAACIDNDGKKYKITVKGFCGDVQIFDGEFKTVITPKHVLV